MTDYTIFNVTNSTLNNNNVFNGGAITNEGSTLTINNSTFENNKAFNGGCCFK